MKMKMKIKTKTKTKTNTKTISLLQYKEVSSMTKNKNCHACIE